MSLFSMLDFQSAVVVFVGSSVVLVQATLAVVCTYGKVV